MTCLKIAILLGVATVALANEKICLNLPGLPIPGCQIEENGEPVIHTAENKTACEEKEGCCWDDRKCVNEDTTHGGKDGPKAVKEEDKNPFKPPRTEQRFLGLPPPCLQQDRPFPDNCKPKANEPYVVVPPVNVPYCVRIPCSLDREKQKSLDKSHLECGSQPGCYFDVELFELRENFGLAVLAGVPVCHMAIRRSVFLREAQKVVYQFGTWNPFYTKCLLDTFDEEIREQPPGCKLIDMLKVYKDLPKLAGWEGITEYECILIGGCWRKNEGCFYPVDVNEIVVKSNQRFKFNRFEVPHGRPKCQHFSDDNPLELLKSYHRCLAAGCSVDADTVASYYENLFEIGNRMSVTDHWQYWSQVRGGKIAASDLLKGIPWKYDETFGGGQDTTTLIPPPPPPPPTRPQSPWQFPGLGSFSLPRPAVPTFPSLSTPNLCGQAYILFGGRPCPPEREKVVRRDWCPYKPFVIPKFKPLQGLFRGCCKINPCYLSRYDVREMHSGPSHYYTEWSFFSPCSVTCGPGVKKRSRRCISPDVSRCTETLEEEQPCNEGLCGKWGPWGEYQPRCRRRFQLQTSFRECLPRGAKCGRNQQTMEQRNRRC